ncbi:MAG: DUF4293 domain-containing protein [Salinivirgaceae bacterium]|nr:DUF4293 domain-containing protein [Salinivirgaceae bacterium]MDD4747272.1 DUF4293 domain-containing protein [Salinivirgaceae bacterium]MDY0279968.1 DUF4293 domain-containing protein [Salinivirgaceae bacterium]
MIQRIQTIFLLIALILGVVLCFIPAATISLVSTEMTLTIFGLNTAPQWYLILLYSPGLLIIAVQIFMFKNRIKQIKMGRMGILIWFLWVGLFSLITWFVFLENIQYQNINFEYGAIFPLVIVFLIRMANRAIKKDENLVRSIDRIR